MPSGRIQRRSWRLRQARTTAVAALCVVALGSCAGTSATQVEVRAETEDRADSTTTTKPPDCADMLPPEGKAAQLLMTMVTSPNVATEALAEGTVGGFGLKGNQTSDVGEQIAAAVEDAPITPSVAADEEGGTVQRLRLALGKIPSAETMAEGTPEEAAVIISKHAEGMVGLGFNMNLAPVADVGSGSGLETRSFGDDPAEVAAFVEASLTAQEEAGITPVVKHWPGIGGGGPDPHKSLPTLAAIDDLRAKDLVPFDRAIQAGAPAIMVTHAAIPNLTGVKEPASLSSEAITGELRGRQGFTGVVMTDSLGMGAIAATTPQDEAAELAITAGADIALISGVEVLPKTHARLVDAITSGRIPADQVQASVRRVLSLKGVTGQCLDAVARYSSIARVGSSTSAPTGEDSGSGTDSGINDSGAGGSSSGGSGSSTTKKPATQSTTTTARPSTTVRPTSTTARPSTTNGTGTTQSTGG